MSDLRLQERCVVTGGAGFIGAHLVRRLLGAGAEVMVFDRAPRDGDHLLKAFGLLDAVGYVGADVTSPTFAHGYGAFRPGVVFHLAGQPISTVSNLLPELTMKVNAQGTAAVCDAARAFDWGPVLLASSACSYGQPEAGDCPLNENSVQREGPYTYTRSKQAAERALLDSGHPGAIARFVNVYGPGDRHFSRIVPRTARQLIQGQTLQLSRGDGSSVLDYLYIDDAVDALLALAHRVLTERFAGIEAYNFGVGADHALSVRALVSKISRAFDGRSRSLTVPDSPPEQAMVKYLDPSKAQRELRWGAKLRLEDGLPPTLAHYRMMLDRLRPLEDDGSEWRQPLPEPALARQ